MRFGSLFAGIGGIDLGLEWAGMECVWQVENDDYCNRVLAEHWPDVERFEDVRKVGKENLAPVDLIAGGFPCQPHSVAGKRRGAEDDRNLWPEFSRIIDELKPRYVLAENVPGIITTYIDEVLSDLENKGYTCGTFNIPAVSLDAPHRRERIFIVAYSPSLRLEGAEFERQEYDIGTQSGYESGVEDVADSSIGSDGAEIIGDKVGGKETKRSTGGAARSSDGSGGVLADSERQSSWGGAVAGSGDRRGGKRTSTGSQNLQPGNGEAHAGELESSSEIVADSEGYLWRTSGDARPITFDWRGPNQTQTLYLAYTWGDRYIYCYWSEAIQNWQEIGVPIPHSKHIYWLPEPNVGRVAHGVPSRVDRLRGLGNAVVPQVAEWVGLRIMEFDTSRKD